MTQTLITQTAKEAAHLYGYKPSGVAKSITAFLKSNKDVDRIDAVNNLIGTDYYDDALQAFGYDLALVAAFDYDKYFSEERVKKTAQKVAVKVSKSKVIKEQKEPVHITKKIPAKLPKVVQKVVGKAKVISMVKPHSLDSLLRLAGSITPRKTALTALQHLKVTANGSLLIEATDLTTAVKLKAPAQQKTKKLLVSFVNWCDVKNLKKIESVLVSDRVVSVNSNEFKEPKDVDLPDLSMQFHKDKVTNSFFIPSDLLQEIWERVYRSISANEFRIAMMGIYVANGVVVTTDGHRLAEYKDKRIKMNGERWAVIPAQTFNTARRIMQGKSVSVSFTDKMVRFEDCTNEVYGVLIDEQYPNYQAVIPRENSNNFTANRKAFISLLKECLPCAHKDTKQVRLNVDRKKVTILTDDADRGLSAKRSLEVKREFRESDVDEILIGYNGTFLLDILNALDTEEITFSLSTPTRAAIITGDKKTLLLLMPVRLSS